MHVDCRTTPVQVHLHVTCSAATGSTAGMVYTCCTDINSGTRTGELVSTELERGKVLPPATCQAVACPALQSKVDKCRYGYPPVSSHVAVCTERCPLSLITIIVTHGMRMYAYAARGCQRIGPANKGRCMIGELACLKLTRSMRSGQLLYLLASVCKEALVSTCHSSCRAAHKPSFHDCEQHDAAVAWHKICTNPNKEASAPSQMIRMAVQ